MSDPRVPASADRSRFRDSTFLLTIAVVALVCGALSFFMQKGEHDTSATATGSEETRSAPLPAGPRKYQ